MAQTVEFNAAVRRRLALRGLLVLALAAFGYNAFVTSLARYTHNFAEVAASSGEKLQVPGVPDKRAPQQIDTEDGTFRFVMRDVEGKGQSLQVISRQVKPGNFDEASQVVCVGQYRDGAFYADKIMVKCPSKEQAKMRAAGGAGGGA